MCFFALVPAVGRAQTADGFNPGPVSPGEPYVFTIAVQTDGKVVVGGAFTQLNGQPRFCIARLNADATLDASFNSEASGVGDLSVVRSIALQPDGKMIVAGQFRRLSGQARSNLGRLNTDGTLDASFSPTPNSLVDAVAIQTDGKIVIGGAFTQLNGQARNYIARLNGDGTLDTAFNPGASGSSPSFWSFSRAARWQDSRRGEFLAAGRTDAQ